ncbi:hypothetical protein [Flavobacterium sp.]|uniref:hypothetical protein n=1 Tax=Flavobacterium sp. TaxID=239 RepID=UPI003C32DEDA
MSAIQLLEFNTVLLSKIEKKNIKTVIDKPTPIAPIAVKILVGAFVLPPQDCNE